MLLSSIWSKEETLLHLQEQNGNQFTWCCSWTQQATQPDICSLSPLSVGWGGKKKKRKTHELGLKTIYLDIKGRESNSNYKHICIYIKTSDTHCSCLPPAERHPDNPWAAVAPTSQLTWVYSSKWCQMIWDIPLATLGQLSWFCPPPASHDSQPSC